MEFRGIRQTSIIEGVNRNPGAGEHTKVLTWNNTLGFFEYKTYFGGGFNTRTGDGIVNKGDDSAAGNYIWKLDSNKNPFWRKEDFLVSAVRSGNSAVFTMNDSSPKTLPLGALAWLDSFPTTLDLPGNTKVLFDDNDTLGGDASFTFDKTNKYIDLTAFTAIRARNGVDVSQKSVLQYLGGKNTLLGHGITRPLTWAAAMTGNTLIGDIAGGSLVSGQYNLMIGPSSGTNTATNISGSVFIGPYSGRLETDSDKFYVGNADQSSLTAFRENSLMYGDFAEGWLRINNRLEVPQEVRIGTFDVGNTPLGGMVQFVDAGGSLLKPQYFDNTNWVDFANGLNYYLQGVTKATADVGTTSAAYQLTFDMNGIADHVLQLGANAFNSDIIPQASIEGTAGLLQISSGDNTDSNRGFSSKAGLVWDEANTELKIPGAIRIATKARYAATGNVITYDNGHYYGRIGGNWVQLDNETTAGQANELRYDGSVTAFDLSLPKDGVFLPIKGIKSIDDRVFIVDNLVDNDLDFTWNIDFGGSNYPVLTSTLSSANVYSTTNTPEGIAPRLIFRPLISSDDSVQFTITANNEIDVSATGTGNPNTYTLVNDAGAGEGLYDSVNSSLTEFKLKTINPTGHLSGTANVNGLQVDIAVDDITLNDLGVGTPALIQDADTFVFAQRTFIDGVATTMTATATEIKYDVNKAIPALAPTPTPVFVVGGTPGQGALSFKANFSTDIRTSATLTATTLHSINIGSGLFYDSITNTLKSLTAEGSTTDYYLAEITRTPATNDLVFNVVDSLGSGADMPITYTFGALAFLDDIEIPIATYTDNMDPHFGGVQINKSTQIYPSGTYQPFTLNETTGELEFTIDPVTYEAQYDLHDADNIAGDNLKRTIARSNSGSAYVNGDIAEDFDADLITANQITIDTISTSEFASDVSKIQNVVIRNQKITSTPENYGVYLSKRETALDAPSEVEVRYGDIAMLVNVDKGSGNVNFMTTTNAGVQTRVAFLDSGGNLHLKGEFITFDPTV